MDRKTTNALIDFAGGPTKFAALLKIDSPIRRQIVNNWRQRGLPPRVVLEHLTTLRRLQRRMERERAGGRW